MKKHLHVAILGAGISGLTTAWYLKKWLPQAEISLLEKTGRVGGWIRSEMHAGFLFEWGPRGFLSGDKGRKTFDLAQEVGLVPMAAARKAKTRYLLDQGVLEAVNFKYLWRKKIFRLLWKERKQPIGKAPDESIGAFFERRLNPSFVQKFINPITRGIYGGDPYQLSLRSCFPKFYHWEKHQGSLLQGALFSPKNSSALYSFPEGMETLPKALYKKLLEKGVKFSFNQEGSTDIEADYVISTLPAPEIPHLSLTLVQIGFYQLLGDKKGFGFLAPAAEEEIVLGMTFDSQVFPQQGTNTRLCLMLKGEVEEKRARQEALRVLKTYLQISSYPDILLVDYAKNAIPQYPVNHYQKVESLKNHRHIHIGTSFFGVGVNDCVAQAEVTAHHLASECGGIPVMDNRNLSSHR